MFIKGEECNNKLLHCLTVSGTIPDGQKIDDIYIATEYMELIADQISSPCFDEKSFLFKIYCYNATLHWSPFILTQTLHVSSNHIFFLFFKLILLIQTIKHN